MANLRPRLDPPLSEDYFGNMSVPTTASVIPWDSEVGFYGFIDPVRDAMSQLNMKENMEKFIKGEVVCMTFTSLCRFPIYEADFGWGEPIWVGLAKLLYRNVVTFLDTKSRNGIEVWINLEEEDMAKFEVDKELLAYVSPKASA